MAALLWPTCVLVLLAGCAPASEPAYRTVPVGEVHSPGEVVESHPFTDLDDALSELSVDATRVVYASTSADGSPSLVSGVVFVPQGTPPASGWPVIAVAHDALGVDPDCGPSLHRDLLGADRWVAMFLRFGWAVTVADYQGLGQPGPSYSYLDSKTAAHNIIDSVRALRAIDPHVSDDWAVLGRSQGGAVAWAANEHAADYGGDLDLAGAVAIAPLADVSALAPAAYARQLTRDQTLVYVLTLMGIADTDPGFPLDAYRRGAAETDWNELRSCQRTNLEKRPQILTSIPADDLAPADEEAAVRLTEILGRMTLPQQRGSAPLLVVYGGGDTVISSESTRAAIERDCALDSKVSVNFQQDRGDGDLDINGFAGWLFARMDGLPPPINC